MADPPEDPGRTARRVATWIVGIVLGAIVAHLLLLPPKEGPDFEPGPGPEEATPAERMPITSLPTVRAPRLRVTPVQLSTPTPASNPLDADRAMGYLRAVCELGPRPSGSPGMKAQQELVAEHFERLGAEVTFQRFKARHPLRRAERVRMANLVAKWRPKATRRVLLCAHYDTRPLPDQDPDPVARRSGRFIGANDGGSGVAVLMELAHLMAERFAGEGESEGLDPEANASLDNPDTLGVDFVLFDAEEFVFSRRDPYFLGSQWFGQRYARRERSSDRAARLWSYEAAVLLDMVGDADLQLYWEGYSFDNPDTRAIVREVWEVARRLGVREFIPERKHEVLDDHIALVRFGGIPAIDIIDFDYPPWHTQRDVPSQCSGESLAKVGWVVWEWLLERAANPPDASAGGTP